MSLPTISLSTLATVTGGFGSNLKQDPLPLSKKQLLARQGECRALDQSAGAMQGATGATQGASGAQLAAATTCWNGYDKENRRWFSGY